MKNSGRNYQIISLINNNPPKELICNSKIANENDSSNNISINRIITNSLPFHSSTRKGVFNWSMDGNQGGRQIDTQGPTPQRDIQLLGGFDYKCQGDQNQPYQPGLTYRERVEGTKIVLSNDWDTIVDGKRIFYRSAFETELISIKQGIAVTAGQRCQGPPTTTQADFFVNLSIRQQRIKDKIILLFFAIDGEIWQNQIGIGTFKITISNGTNNQLLSSDQITENRINSKITDIFSTDAVPDGHDFRVDIRHDCSVTTETVGAWTSTGARFTAALAIETSREKI